MVNWISTSRDVSLQVVEVAVHLGGDFSLSEDRHRHRHLLWNKHLREGNVNGGYLQAQLGHCQVRSGQGSREVQVSRGFPSKRQRNGDGVGMRAEVVFGISLTVN